MKATNTRAVVTGFLTADLMMLMALLDYLDLNLGTEGAAALDDHHVAFLQPGKDFILRIEMAAELDFLLPGDAVLHYEDMAFPGALEAHHGGIRNDYSAVVAEFYVHFGVHSRTKLAFDVGHLNLNVEGMG